MNPGTAGLARGLDVLAALGEPEAARDGLGVVRLAALVGGDKSQLSRTLATLAEQGFVERDPETLAYRLGWRVFALAARAAESRLLVAGAGGPARARRRARRERAPLGQAGRAGR